MDKIISAITDDGSVVCYAIDSSQLVAESEKTHQTSPVVSAALGRLLTIASLMGSQIKEEHQNMTLRVDGGGPIGTLLAVSDWEGNVRGYAAHPQVEVPLTSRGFLDVGTAVGSDGFLTVMRELGRGFEPYVGSIQLVSGEIAEDVTAYYAQSQQIPTVCALGVEQGEDGTVSLAGGFLAQLLPGAALGAVDRLEDNIQQLPAVSTMLKDGLTPEEMAFKVLEGMDPHLVSEFPVEYRCNCTRERVERVLINLGLDDLKALREEEEVVEVNCHFCNKVYTFTREDLDGLIAAMEDSLAE